MRLPGELPAVVRTAPMDGGDIATVDRAELADGSVVVVKRTPYDARLEAEGLGALGAAGAHVPGVLAVAHPAILVRRSSRPTVRVVPPARLERATDGLEGRCSIH